MPKDESKTIRGLRQEDPFSPFLFTIAVDVLSRMMPRAKKSGLLEGFLVGRDRIIVSHLQFAKDTIFFSRASIQYLQNLKLILLVYGNISWLTINLDKSTLSRINTS